MIRLGTYSDCYPMSARITINYDNKKVSFSYPEEKTKDVAFWEFFRNVYAIFLSLEVMVVATVGVFMLLSQFTDFLFLVYNFRDEKASLGLLYSLANPSFIAGFFFLILIFGAPAIVTILLFKNYSKISHIYPVVMAWFHGLFGGSQIVIIRRVKDNVAVLPIFQNVKLEYKLEGNFAKYIKKISVKPSDFMFLEKNDKGKEEEVGNARYWEAKFIFSKNPTGNGKLLAKFI